MKEGVAAKSYDSLNNFMGYKSAKRNTFIIDPARLPIQDLPFSRS